jgi:hypothetical protein
MTYVLCEAFCFKTFSLKAGNRVAGSIVDQDVLAIVLVDTTRQRSGTGFTLRGRLLLFRLSIGLCESGIRSGAGKTPDER